MKNIIAITSVLVFIGLVSDFLNRIYRPINAKPQESSVLTIDTSDLVPPQGRQALLAELEKLSQQRLLTDAPLLGQDANTKFSNLDGKTVGSRHIVLIAIYEVDHTNAAVVAFYPDVASDYEIHTVRLGEHLAELNVIALSTSSIEFAHPDGRFTLVLFAQKDGKKH